MSGKHYPSPERVMLEHPNFNQVAFEIGPLAIHWYGITYIVAFGGAWLLARYRIRSSPGGWTDEQVSDLVFYGALGAVIGGRLGSVLFYNFDRFLGDPLWLFKVWDGGMSFHGGFLGVLAAYYWYSRRIKRPYFEVMDFIAPFAPFGIAAVRFGNFINAELWGRPTDVPWGMVFPMLNDGGIPRHPSQLYEMALEGIVLFVILWWFSSRPRPRGAVAGVFAIGYSVFRIFVEFFREPDLDIGFIAFDWLTMGQLLSLPMLIAGVALTLYAYRSQPEPDRKPKQN
jgi:phosphatidylglycerol:prolipoprotein diacylglycerol transferase